MQVTVTEVKTGTVRFHQERLAGPEERERQRAHWGSVIERLFGDVITERRSR